MPVEVNFCLEPGRRVSGWTTEPHSPLDAVLMSLGVGLVFVRTGGMKSTAAGRWAAVLLLACPPFFSGLGFSRLLSRAAEAWSALGRNLLGAMAGGVLEYNSMYFGFQSQYRLAVAVYAAGHGLFLANGGSRTSGSCL